MTEQDINTAAEEVLSAHAIAGLPIDPRFIANKEKIALAPGSYANCFDGRIEYHQKAHGGKFYLFYAQEEPGIRTEGRVNFSIAHELGHYFLPEHRQYLLTGKWHNSHIDGGFLADKRLEREADQFAAALLMPRQQFNARVELKSRQVCTLSDLTKFASDIFKTSITSTTLRYVQLDFEPCCMIITKEGRVVYNRTSESLRIEGLGWLDRGVPVPPTSITAKLLKAAEENQNQSAEGEIHADIWFGKQASRRLWEEVKTLGYTGLTITFLALNED